MKLHIKNMVSARCIELVTSIAKDMGLSYQKVDLGEISINQQLSLLQELEFKNKLQLSGLDLLNDNRLILSERIKNIVIDLIHNTEEKIKINFSIYLSEKMNLNYTYLSNVFRSVNGITIQQFIIFNKIEKIKELLVYGELNLSEISYRLNYSSIAHLSNQFKKITGSTPTEYKNNRAFKRIPLEKIGL